MLRGAALKPLSRNTASTFHRPLLAPLRIRSYCSRQPRSVTTIPSSTSVPVSTSRTSALSHTVTPLIAAAIHQQGCRAFNSSSVTMAHRRRLERPAIFICDLQEKFRPAIWQFDKILLTTQKLLRGAKILNIPVHVTTQNAARLGNTVSELQPYLSHVTPVDKTLFSMWVPEIQQHFDSSKPSEIVIVGIESHVCVTQTALDLLAAGHKVYVLADGVSSANQQEVPIALDRLRSEGVIVTTSESFLFECMGTSTIPEFRDVSKLIKETKSDTMAALSGLSKM